MMKKSLILLMCFLNLAGCNEVDNNPTTPTASTVVGKNKIHNAVLTELVVTQDIFVMALREGDKVYFRIKGVRKDATFSPTYKKTLYSRWSEKVWIPTRKEYVKIPQFGECDVTYRDLIDEQSEIPIDLISDVYSSLP